MRKQVAVGVPQRLRERGTLHPAPVDQQHLAFARGTRVLGQPEECAHGVAISLGVRLEQLVGMTRAPDLRRPRSCAAGGAPIESLALVDHQTPADVRPGKRIALDHADAGPQLARGRVQELAARGRVVEQIADLDRGAGLARHETALRDHAAIDSNERRSILAGRPRDEL